MTLAEDEFARRENGRVVIRPSPLRVSWTFADLPTATWHTVRATFACSLTAVDSSADRAMLEEVLLGDRLSLSGPMVAEHFQGPLRAAMVAVVEQSQAEQLVSGQMDQAVIEAVTKAAERVAFACGLQVLPPYSLEMSSPSLEQDRREQAARARAAQRTAGQVEHLRRAGELLKQFQDIRSSAPQLSAGAVLQQMSPADRGVALETLLMAQAEQAPQRTLWLVAGPHLLRIVKTEQGPSAELMAPPAQEAPIGPLRSVQGVDLDGRRMLLGARRGLVLTDTDARGEAQTFLDPALESAHGFSRAVAWGDGQQLLACHSEGGIVAWSRDTGEAPLWMLRAGELAQRMGLDGELPRIGPKNLQAIDDGSALFSMGNVMVVLRGREPRALPAESASEIVAIVEGPDALLVVHQDGLVCRFDRAMQQITQRLRPSGAVSSAGALPWMENVRLLLGCAEGAIDCVGLDDQLVTRYLSNHRGARMVAGASELVAAVSPDRQRLILWNSWDGRSPVAELYITGIAKHRIADAEFI